MRNYETLYVLQPGLEEEQLNSVITKFSDLVANAGGEVVRVDRWGKRRLAYEVKKLREGYYVLMLFNGTASVAKELERVFKITDEVIRQLIVRLEDGLPANEESEEDEVKTETETEIETETEVETETVEGE
ncbi:MAG: 30S ribosomal protein S6 [Bacillota bacterium]